MVRLVWVVVLLGCIAGAMAGGTREEQGSRGAKSPSGMTAAELQEWYASRQLALSETYAATAASVNKVIYRNARKTAVLRPTKDRYGDPMYVNYGPRAYAGTPWYNGPAYVASFGNSRDIPYAVLEGTARSSWPGALADPGYAPRTDVTLGVGATHMYMQHGMVSSPGSVAPSYARPMQFNRY